MLYSVRSGCNKAFSQKKFCKVRNLYSVKIYNKNDGLKSCSKYLRELNLSSTDDTDDARCNRINFLCDQMEYVVVKQHGVQYNTNTMRDSINLYLRSRNCYNAVRDVTILLHKDTVKSYFGKLG